MDSETHDLHLLFFPLMAPGHFIPMVDIAKLFAARGVKSTILTTPANASTIIPAIDLSKKSGHRHPITLTLIPFPSAEVGLPAGCENIASVPTKEMIPRFQNAVEMLRQPFEKVLRELLPDCIITDTFLPWTIELASELAIPRLVFHGTSFFALCASNIIYRSKPLDSLPGDEDSFIVPGLPHRIQMLRSQIPNRENLRPGQLDLFNRMRDSEERSYGVVVNSFYELEPDYAEHYRKVVGRKAWNIGPVSLSNTEITEISSRGVETSIDMIAECLNWLNGKSPGSVIYVCFGSLSRFTAAQLRETALGLEASGHPFIWVVRERGSEWMPEGFEERVVGGGMGLIIRAWAPQILILNHAAVGGFLTHCGWNSSLEGVSAGVAMVTWPLFAEQFYNERLIVDVLRIGIAIGVKDYVAMEEERALVMGEEIGRAVDRVMGGGEEAEAMRRRAKMVGEMARAAVEDGGSSYIDMGNLIKDLTDRKSNVGRERNID